MYKDAILLDENLSRGLIRQSLQDGYAKRAASSESETDPTLIKVDQNIMSSYRRSRLSSKALEYLLLYPEIYLYHPCEIVDLSRLAKYIPFKIVVPDSLNTKSLSYLCSDEGYQTAMSFKPVLLPILRYRSRNEILKDLKITNETYDIYVDSFRRGGSVGNYENLIEMLKDPRIFRMIAKSYGLDTDSLHDLLLKRDRESRLDFYGEMALKLMPYTTDISNHLVDMLGLLRSSGSLNIPAASSYTIPIKYTKGERFTPNYYTDEETMRCFYIFLEEIDSFPVVETIDDVLKLRDDKRIINWRGAIRDWSIELRAGNAEAEKNMRRSIRSAIRDLKRLGAVKNISGLMTVVSLPVAIYEAMAQLIGPGFAMTGLSIAIEGYSRSIEWKHKWLLLGRS
jgi:hypothetical protein